MYDDVDNQVLNHYNQSDEIIIINRSTTKDTPLTFRVYYDGCGQTPSNVSEVVLESYRFETQTEIDAFGDVASDGTWNINTSEVIEGDGSVSTDSGGEESKRENLNTARSNVSIVANQYIDLSDTTGSALTRFGTRATGGGTPRLAIGYYPDVSAVNFTYRIATGANTASDDPITQGWNRFRLYVNDTGITGYTENDDFIAFSNTATDVGCIATYKTGIYAQFDAVYIYRDYGGLNPTLSYSGVQTDTSNFTVYFDEYDTGDDIDNVSVHVVGSGYDKTFTGNNNITLDILNNNTNYFNFTLGSTSKGGFFNRTYYNVRGNSSYLYGMLWQSEIKLSASELATENALKGVFHTNVTQSNGSVLRLIAGTYPITFVNSSYFNQTQSFTLSALENTSGTITGVYDTVLNITANTSLTNTVINNFTVNISATNISYSYNSTNSTTSGIVQFNVMSGINYSLIIDADGYAITTAYRVPTASYDAYNFSLFTTNSIAFTFRNEETNAIINNVSLELIASSYSANYSTTNGTLFLELLTPSTYTVRYNSVGFLERTYIFNLLNRSHNNLTLYLLSNTTGTAVTATVYDNTASTLEDVYIKVLRYDVSTNSYTIREIQKTNFEGETVLNLVLNDEYYKFILEYPLGTVRKETTPTYIYDTSLVFQIDISEGILENYYSSMDISYNLIYNTASQSFRYTYSDANNLVQRGCMKVYEYTNRRGWQPYNTTCINGAAGTILIKVDNTTGNTYRADAFVDFSDETDYFLVSLIKSFKDDSVFGSTGILLIMFMTIIFIFMGYWEKSVALIITPIPLMIGSVIGIIDISLGLCVGIEIICIIIAIWISRS
jgi:hypothetical protein